MTDRPRLLKKEFDLLMAHCFRRDQRETMDQAQIRDLERFFMAGARGYSNLVMANADQGDEPTPADMALMEALELEMDLFIVDVQAGRA